MSLSTILLPLAAAFMGSAAPPLEVSDESTIHADRRLRACLSTHASDGHATIEAAVAATRAACKRQIDDARDVRIIQTTAGLDPQAAQVVAQRVTRELNTEIAKALATCSGLPLPHAHD